MKRYYYSSIFVTERDTGDQILDENLIGATFPY